MIPKKFRAPKETFFKKPHHQASSLHFRAKVFPNNLGHNRFAAVVGTKTDKSSVRRHFWKRLIMNIAWHESGTGKDKDIVIVAGSNLGNISKAEAKKELETIFKKINQTIR